MKQILFLLFVASTSAANAQRFEGGFLLPGFEKQIPIHEVNLTGKGIGCSDYTRFQKIDAPILSKDEALTLALMLIKAPKELRLGRDIGNIIRSTGGYVTIFFSPSIQTWALNFHAGEDVTAAGDRTIRCFYTTR